MKTIQDLKNLIEKCETMQNDLLLKYRIDPENQDNIIKFNSISYGIDAVYDFLEEKIKYGG